MFPRTTLLCLLLLAALSPTFAQTTVQATRAQRPPALDGKLDDACWAAAKPVNAFLINNTDQPSKLTTTAILVYDDTGIYLGMKCGEANPASLVTECLPRDNPNVWRNDCVEIMLDPTGSQNDYFHIAINAAGQIADRACTQGGFIGDMSWDSTASGAAFIGPDYWSAELAIPFNCLGITPAVGANWRVNICREKRVPQELSSIAAKGAFNNAASFVPLQGIAADLSRYCYEIGLPVAEKSVRNGKLDLTLQVPLRNLSTKPDPLLLNAWLTSPSGKVYSVDKAVELTPNQPTTQSLGPLTLEEQGEYTC
ncbi:MAG: sugar-binding protein, partial [Bacteroidota bacterium]